MTRFTTLMTICTLALTCQAAFAGPAPDALSVKVRFADLDLTHRQGVAVLYDRITYAAKTVCRPFEGRDLKSAATTQHCIRAAISTAVATVNWPALTAYHQMRTGVSSAPLQVAAK
jgi:UrcA family protein